MKEENNPILVALRRQIQAQEKENPHIAAQIASRIILDKLLALLKDDSGVHVESAFAMLGALAGYACQQSAVYALAHGDSSHTVMVIDGADGKQYLFGDAINQPLAEAPLSLWALLAGQAEHLGDHELPDLDAIIAHVSQSVGTPEFGKPRLPPGHDEIRFTPQESLELLWQPFVASLLQALEVPAADWLLACGLAIQELMAQGKNVLAPHLAATIVMECAVPMSKIVMKN